MKADDRVAQLRRLLLGVLCMLAALPARAYEIPGYPADVQAFDPREVAMLPGYCKYTQVFRERVPGGGNQAEIERWYAFMGPAFHSMHHYCWGLMKTNRAVLLARTREARQFYLADSIDEFDFVLRSNGADDNFILLPEILTKKGENLIRLGKGPIAVLHLEKATQLKPDYWPPYAHLSDYYKSEGDIGQAREWLQKGLALAPDAVGLQRRLRELPGAKKRDTSSAEAR